MIVAACYFSYLLISIALTVWVARTLHRSGRIFLVDAFHGNELLADSVNHLLVVRLLPGQRRLHCVRAEDELRDDLTASDHRGGECKDRGLCCWSWESCISSTFWSWRRCGAGRPREPSHPRRWRSAARGDHLVAVKAGKKSEETRSRILEAALTVFKERGFDKASMREIAAQAGVANGAAYYYFDSKDALVMAFYERSQGEMHPAIEAKLDRARKAWKSGCGPSSQPSLTTSLRTGSCSPR